MNERKKGKKKRRDFWRRNSSFSRHVQLKEIDIRYSCRSTRKSNAGLEWMMQQQLKYFSNYFFGNGWIWRSFFLPIVPGKVPKSIFQGSTFQILLDMLLYTVAHRRHSPERSKTLLQRAGLQGSKWKIGTGLVLRICLILHQKFYTSITIIFGHMHDVLNVDKKISFHRLPVNCEVNF